MKSNSNTNVTFLEKVQYGFGGMFKSSLGGYIANLYWLFFLTDVVGIPTLMAATANTAVRFLKVFSMMFCGVLVDSTNFKTGKYRTWILIGDIVMFITSGLLFLKYDFKSPIMYISLLLIIYFIQITAYNVSWTSSRALVGVMAVNTSDSVALTASANIGSTLAGTIYGFAGPVVLNMFANTENQYMYSAYVFGIIYIIGTIVMWNVSGKYETLQHTGISAKNESQTGKVPFKDMIICLKGPGAWFCISSTVMNISSGIQGVLLVYYTTYVLQNPLMTGYSVTAQSISGFCAALMSPLLCAKLSKKRVYALSMFTGGICFALYYFIGSNGLLFLLIKIISTICTTPVGTAMVAMANDIADYNAMKGTVSAKAFVQSMMGLTIRIGGLISTALASFGFAAIGYESGTVPSGEILNAIVTMMSFIPAIAYIFAGILILFYKIDENEIERYRISKAA